MVIPKIFSFFKNKTAAPALSQLIEEQNTENEFPYGVQPPSDLSQMFLTQREVRRPNPTGNSPAGPSGEDKGIITKEMIQSLKRVKYNSQGPQMQNRVGLVENTNTNNNLSFSELLTTTEEPFRPNPMEEEYSRFRNEDSTTNTASLFELISNNNLQGARFGFAAASMMPITSSIIIFRGAS